MSLAGTRLSAHPMKRKPGFCWSSRRLKKSGSRPVFSSTHLRLFSKIFVLRHGSSYICASCCGSIGLGIDEASSSSISRRSISIPREIVVIGTSLGVPSNGVLADSGRFAPWCGTPT